MTSLQRLLAEVIGGLLLLCLFIGLWVHHDTTQRALGAATCYATVTETKQQAQNEQKEKDLKYAEQLATDHASYEERIATLSSMPAIRTPIILHDGSLYTCPAASNAQAGDVHPQGGSTQPGPGDRDIRSGIESFKLRYEGILAKCQQDLDDWPTK